MCCLLYSNGADLALNADDRSFGEGKPQQVIGPAGCMVQAAECLSLQTHFLDLEANAHSKAYYAAKMCTIQCLHDTPGHHRPCFALITHTACAADVKLCS